MSTPTPPAAPGAHPYPPGAPSGTPSTTSPHPGHGYAAPPQAAPLGRGPEPDVGDVSVGQLISQVTRDLSTLVRQELALAQAELRQEATKTGKAAGALGAAGTAALFMVLFLSIALWAGLSNVMDAGWAGLLVAVLWAIIAAVLFMIGRARLREVHPKPERTVDTLSSVPDALQGRRGGTQ